MESKRAMKRAARKGKEREKITTKTVVVSKPAPRRKQLRKTAPLLPRKMEKRYIRELPTLVTTVNTTGGHPTIAALDLEWRKATRRSRMTGAGATWLKACMDPMHDSPISMPAGWPDRNSGKSVVRHIPYNVTIGYPGLVSGGNPNFPVSSSAPNNWDCHVILNPWLNQINMTQYSRTNNVCSGVVIPSTAGVDIGGLQAFGVVAGADFAYGSPNPNTGTAPLLATLELEETYTVGMGRLVGIGIEVKNTTALNFVQGNVCVWRAPEPIIQSSAWEVNTMSPVFQAPFTPQFERYPPANQSEALLYGGPIPWLAKDGAYMPGYFNTIDNPPCFVDYLQPSLIYVTEEEDNTTDANNFAGTINTSNVWTASYVTVAGNPACLPATKIYPINQMGMIFTGLSQSTNLSIAMVVYYESFPSIAQSDILVLARPSSPYDPVALSYLTRLQSRMPVGVCSAENYDGEWFATVLEWLAGAAPLLGTAIGLPELGVLAGGGLSYAAKAIRQ